MKTFVESVDEFVSSADWLLPTDGIAVTSLYQMAQELDQNGMTGPIMSAFGLAYRSLLKRAPVAKQGSKLGEFMVR
jgi:hypothetical protein